MTETAPSQLTPPEPVAAVTQKGRCYYFYTAHLI